MDILSDNIYYTQVNFCLYLFILKIIFSWFHHTIVCSMKIFTLSFMYSSFYLYFKSQVKHFWTFFRIFHDPLYNSYISGTIKNIILVCLANKKIGEVAARSVTEQSESQLSDTNAWVQIYVILILTLNNFRYMAITFYQAILAFCLQDGGTALMQVHFKHILHTLCLITSTLTVKILET